MGGSPSCGADDLSGRTSRGAAATLATDLLVRGLAFVAIVAVARLLDPGPYGTVVLALTVFGFADVLSNPAMATALLREPELTDRKIDVAWTLAVVRGLLLTTAFWLLAPLLASCWPDQQTELQGYFRILAASFGCSGLLNLHYVRLRRQLRFPRALMVESVSPVTSGLFAIVALLLAPEPVWLVVAPVVGLAAGSLLSLVLVTPRPRFAVDREATRELWRFGVPMVFNGAMGYVLVAGDHVFVQYLAGTAALGVYGMSYRWTHMAVRLLAQGLQPVLMPVYVLMRDDHVRTRHAVLSSLSILTALCGVVSGLFLAFATEFFSCLGGDAWNGAGPVARALVPLAIAYGVNICLTPVFLVHGKPQWLSRVIGAQLLCFFPVMYLGHALLGLPGLALGVSLLALGVAAVQMTLTRALIGLRPLQFAAAIVPPLSVAGLAALTGWLAVLPARDPMVRLFVGSGVAVVGFLVAWELLCRHPLARRLPSRSFLAIAGLLGR
jgi:PST family polysaccharide transporter/lipopolysaccharide exporter